MIQNTTNIQEIIPPTEVSYWPPQPGWYALGVVILIIIGIALLRFRKHKQLNTYRKDALKTLHYISNQEPTAMQLHQLNQILKACALKTYPRAQVAHLSGSDWVSFLNSTSRSVNFSQIHADLLSSSQYEKTMNLIDKKQDYSDLFNQSEGWIKTHKLYKD